VLGKLKVLLSEKTQIRCLEGGEVRENGRQIRVCHSEPSRKRRRAWIHGWRGNPSAVASGVVWPTERLSGKLSVKRVPLHSVAHDHLVAAPRVVRSAVGPELERASKQRG
jgi:hypothetical protein